MGGICSGWRSIGRSGWRAIDQTSHWFGEHDLRLTLEVNQPYYCMRKAGVSDNDYQLEHLSDDVSGVFDDIDNKYEVNRACFLGYHARW